MKCLQVIKDLEVFFYKNISDEQNKGDNEMDNKGLIRELFPFEKPLTSRFRKKYVETLALGILQYCYKEKYDGFEVHDAPDISDGNKLIGIEVTEAVSDEQAQIQGEFVKYRLESRTEEKERRKRIIEENGASVNQLGLTYPVKNGDDEKQIFQNAIRKKMEKLESYRIQGYQKVGLYVFYDEPPIPVKLEELKDYFDEAMNGYNDKYDIIYFVHSFGLIEYDVLTDEVQVIPIERSIYNKLRYDARVKIGI